MTVVYRPYWHVVAWLAALLGFCPTFRGLRDPLRACLTAMGRQEKRPPRVSEAVQRSRSFAARQGPRYTAALVVEGCGLCLQTETFGWTTIALLDDLGMRRGRSEMGCPWIRS